MTVTRTIELTDIEPAELAELFCEMDSEKQADFFRLVGVIARSWPGAGWCQQSCSIAGNLEITGRETIIKFAEHVLDCENLEAIVAASLTTTEAGVK